MHSCVKLVVTEPAFRERVLQTPQGVVALPVGNPDR